MLDQSQPWLDDPQVDHLDSAPVHVPRIPAQGGNPATTEQAAQPWANDQPVAQPQGDQSTTVPDEYIGGFSDQLPKQIAYKMSPQDEAAYSEILHHGTLQDAIKFLADRNRPPPEDPEWFAARDNAIKHGGKVGYSITYRMPTGDEVRASGADTGGAPGAMTRGALDSLTLGAAGKLGTLGRTVSDQIHGTKNSFGDDWNIEADRRAAITQEDQAQHPWAKIAGQIEGGAVLPMGLEGVAVRAETQALNAGKSLQEAHQIGIAAVRNRVAATASGYGAAHGAISADTPGNALTGAITEGALGAATGKLLPAVGDVVAKPFRSIADLATGSMTGRVANEALQPFVDEGVKPLAADVGGTFTRMATGTSNMTLGGIPLADAAHKSIADAQGLKSAIADRIGTASRDIMGRSDTVGAGLAAQRGVQATLGDAGPKQAIVTKLYNAVPIPGAKEALVGNTKQALASLNEGLSSNSELSALISDPRLAAYERAFSEKTKSVPTGILDASGQPITREIATGGKLNWQDLKNFRSYIGELAGRPTLQDSTSKDALQALYGALSKDMQATASATSPVALAKFMRANTYYRALQARKEQVLQPLLGNKMDASGEDAFRQIQRWSTNSGDVFALGRSLRSMPPEEANAVRATLFDRLGTVSAGRQDAAGAVWSPNDFVTHWNGISSRAKSVLFPGAEYRNSIDNLVRIASSQKGAQAYANVSKTGNAVNGAALLTGFFTNPLATLPVALGQIGAGKILASPRFARWLGSSVGKPNPSAALAHINRLSSIARAEPAIANEVLQLQQRLASAFTGSSMPTRLAAQEPTNEADGGQGNASEQQPENQSLQP